MVKSIKKVKIAMDESNCKNTINSRDLSTVIAETPITI
jgi:hypothetical protein